MRQKRRHRPRPATATGTGAVSATGVASPAAGVTRESTAHHEPGAKTTTSASSTSTAAAHTSGRTLAGDNPGSVRPGRSRKGVPRPPLPGSSATEGAGGSRSSTGLASIFNVRQTVCASARTKVASGSSSWRSFSSASSLRGETLMAAASAAM
jgi:hypothetical protein